MLPSLCNSLPWISTKYQKYSSDHRRFRYQQAGEWTEEDEEIKIFAEEGERLRDGHRISDGMKFDF